MKKQISNNEELLNLELLRNSKGYKSGMISFETPVNYLNQVQEIMNETAVEKAFTPLKCRFEKPVTNINEDGTENTSYPRFLLQYETKIPKNLVQTFTFGMLVALDNSQPVIKVFSGLNTSACLNLSIYSADHLSISFLKDSNYKRVFSDLKSWLEKYGDLAKKFIDSYTYLENTEIKNPQEFYGKILEQTYRDKQTTQPILDSFRSTLIQEDSKYFNDFRLSNIYESLTQPICEKTNFLNQPNESLYFYNLLTNLKN
jgi:hypothetical protein